MTIGNHSMMPHADGVASPEYGLTKREYFAAMAMQGLLTNFYTHGLYGNHPSQPMVHEKAVEQADLLIKALNEPTTTTH